MIDHIKGVLIALGIAIVVIFALSLLMPQQIVIEDEVVINKSQDSVYLFLKEPKHVKHLFGDLEKVVLQEKESGTFVFKGGDGELYQLEVKAADQANGIEVNYFKSGEKTGVFIFKTKAFQNQTLLSQVQFWNLGLNPITKLLGHKTKDQTVLKLKDEMLNVKMILEK